MEESYENVMNILSIDDAKRIVDHSKKVVIVTGVTGQDGSFMTDYLLQNTDYQIFGGVRRLSVYNHNNVEHLKNEPRFHLINFDLTDAHSISQIIGQLSPNYFINFAAQSYVKSSWDFPAQTWETNTTGVLNILEAIRLHTPNCRFYNAGSSEEFGNVEYYPQDERHPLRPRSPYGASKAAARQLVKVYRESYGLYAVQGWLFNHEGTRRGEEFVTRKITKAVAKIKLALLRDDKFEPIELGNLDAKRDWSDAEDCVDAVWRMLNQDEYSHDCSVKESNYLIDRRAIGQYIKEYVVSSGENHSIREFVEKAFSFKEITGRWVGQNENEKYIGNNLREIFVKINPANYRPAEVNSLCGDSTEIREELGWRPNTTFDELVKKMVRNDFELESSTIKSSAPYGSGAWG